MKSGTMIEVLVHISVTGSKISGVYPPRVEVFFRGVGHDPVKPNEVRWVVHGLSTDQSITISPNKPDSDLFNRIPIITESKDAANSGPAKEGPTGSCVGLLWKYDIFLMKGGAQQDMLDPEVVIKNDP